jgi:MFS family permease
MIDRDLPRARLAVAAVFLANGALFANLVPRYPEIRTDLGLTNAALGTAIAAFPLGALAAGLLAAPLIGRFGSARVAIAGVVALAVALASIPAAGTWAAFAGIMFVAGGLDAVTDVAMNAHGLRVQRRYGRSIVNSFHGIWSIGAVAGGLMSAALLALEVSLTAALVTASVTFTVVALVSRRFMLPGPDGADRPHHDHVTLRGVKPSTLRILAALGVLAACGAVVEDAAASWGALYLGDDLGTTAALAGLAFVAFQTAMTMGRLTGDRVVDRFGQRTVVRNGAVLAAVAMGAALVLHTPWAALVGFALAGLGVATLVPAAMHTGDELPGLPPGVGLTVVSVLLRVGFLASPPLVGITADAISLRAGLLGVVAAGAIVVVFSRVLLQHNPVHDSGATSGSARLPR